MTREAKKIEEIDIQRFQQILDSYGSNADRWPAKEREAALALLRLPAARIGSPASAAGRDRRRFRFHVHAQRVTLAPTG